MSHKTPLYDWPRAAAFGRVIPKNKIYEHSGAKTALKELFVRQVHQVVWTHKLAPETINLEATEQVAEIQVFRVISRAAMPDHEILRAMDRAIPFPLIFEIVHEHRIRMAAAYKRPSEAGGDCWVVGEYFESEWTPKGTPRAPLPLALNLGVLYEKLLSPLVEGQTARLFSGMTQTQQAPLPRAVVERPVPLQERIERAEAIRRQAREVERLKARLARTKQFNRRVEVNAELRAAKQKLQELMWQQEGEGET